jgi:hypothetical protein
MRKFLRFYLPFVFLFIAICIFAAGYVLVKHPRVVAYFDGESTIISPPADAVVRIGGVEQSEARVFEKDGNFFLKSKAFDLLVIDKSRKDVLLPNAGCSEMVFSKYLFEEDCLHSGFFFSGEKGGGFNTELEISDSNINFFIPKIIDGRFEKGEKIEIIFKGV